MTLLRKIKEMLFPARSMRGTCFAVLRESICSPEAFFNRLNSINFSNYKTAKTLSIVCNVCGVRTSLFYDFPNLRKRSDHEIGILRETLSCSVCGATMRQRTLGYKLIEYINQKTRQSFVSLADYVASDSCLRILDTDCFSAIHRVLKGKTGYISSKFLPNSEFGVEIAPGIYNINLESISFDDCHFDVVLTSDVMEHVKYDNFAHAEINRVLVQGGAYIFTVPFNSSARFNRVLVLESDAGEIFLERPHYHGDPLGSGILAYRIYGEELIKSLNAIGFEAIFEIVKNSKYGIFQGDCFIATKI